jgi:predicted nucleotidyltransferase
LAREESDIDIAILFDPNAVPDKMELMQLSPSLPRNSTLESQVI